MNRRISLQVALAAGVFAAACTGARDTELDDRGITHLTDPTEPTEDGELAAEEIEPGAPKDSGGSSSSSGNAGGPSAAGCAFEDAIDHDGDGLSFLAGDCNDCDAAIRPGKIDIAGNGVDEDCSGKADEDASCDAALALASTDAREAARALGVCHSATANSPGWGVITARYVKPDRTPLDAAYADGHGLLEAFGASAPRYGETMLALSTGAARAPGQPGYEPPSGHDKGYAHAAPPGWPKPSPACPGVTPSTVARDGVALELTVKVPVDAHAMSFDHALFTYEYAQYVCSQFTDSFVVLMDPPPAGAVSGNIVFDALGGAVGVNSALLAVCAAGTHKGITFGCGQGTAGLQGTGFEGHGATGWLRTTAPVQPGSTITLLFAVWDAGDGTYDTTVLLDSLRFWTQPVAKVQTVAK